MAMTADSPAARTAATTAPTAPVRTTTHVPMGPPWWGAVMGTGITATLSQIHIGDTFAWPGRVLLLAGWVLMVWFALGFAVRVARAPRVWGMSWEGVGASAWGMVSMGLLSVAAATAQVVPPWAPALTGAAWAADHLLWLAGTVLGLVSTFRFVFQLLADRPMGPRPAWGLAVVPPMVTATVGAPLVGQLRSDAWAFLVLTFLAACFVCSLTLGLMIFVSAYQHHHRDPIPTQAATSAFIPLGVVGQSTAATQVIAAGSARFLTPAGADAAQRVANGYGVVMLAVAVPLVALAVLVTVRAALGGMAFTPGWWAMTFPIGTLSLGAHNLGGHLPGYGVAGAVVWGCLLGTWTLCAVTSLRAGRRALAERLRA